MSELAEFYVHTVAVETLSGGGPMGETYADPVDVPCFIDEKRRLIRDASGNETVSETTLWMDKAHYDLFAPGSTVTYRDRVSTVIGRSEADSGALDLPDHLEISLA